MFRQDSERRPSKRDDLWYEDALYSLRNEVSKVENDISSIKDNLSDEYPKEALDQMARHFQNIAELFIDFVDKRNSKHYGIIRRSKDRVRFSRNIINTAKNTAKLLERYAKKPKTYSRVECALKINKLLAELENLRTS